MSEFYEQNGQDPFEQERQEAVMRVKATVAVVAIILLIVGGIWGSMHWGEVVAFVKEWYGAGKEYLAPYLPHAAPSPTEMPTIFLVPELVFTDVDYRDRPYEKPTFETGHPCEGGGYPNVRFNFAENSYIEFIAGGSGNLTEIRYYDGTTQIYDVGYLQPDQSAVFSDQSRITNCGDSLVMGQTITMMITIVYPTQNWYHLEDCNLSTYRSEGLVSSETDKTRVSGAVGEDGMFTASVSFEDGYLFTIKLDVRTRHLEYQVFTAGVTEAIESGWWDYEFRGETLIIQLSNGEYVFVYIPYRDGWPNQYLYTTGTSLESGGCRP